MAYLDPIEGALREGRQANAIADLDLTISDPPEDAEVQAVADKVDELLGALRFLGLIAPGDED